MTRLWIWILAPNLIDFFTYENWIFGIGFASVWDIQNLLAFWKRDRWHDFAFCTWWHVTNLALIVTEVKKPNFGWCLVLVLIVKFNSHVSNVERGVSLPTEIWFPLCDQLEILVLIRNQAQCFRFIENVQKVDLMKS